MSDEHRNHVHAFRNVPRTGVIYVTAEATKLGFSQRDRAWCNLGQGQPETGDLPDAPPRVHTVPVDVDDQEYAPVPGVWELREAIAGLYNRLYRKGMPSRYAAENVSISGGGRTALTRAAASLGHVNLGHFLPDYTAYEELLDIFKAFTAIPILLEGDRGYAFTAEDLRKEIAGRGLSALLASNPCNPTGKLVQGEELARWIGVARDLDCTLMLDEFYSHYIWTGAPGRLPVESAARYVEDVNSDPVMLFDGLTKNWRYPGWRVTWTLGPKSVIEAVAAAAGRHPAPGGGAGQGGDARHPPHLRREARPPSAQPRGDGHPHRPRARRHLLRLGLGGAPPAAALGRDGILPRRAHEEGHLCAGRVLRREPGQAPEPRRVALPPVRALLVRPVARDARDRARPAEGAYRRGAGALIG